MGKAPLIVLMLLAGCATPAPVENPRAIWCDFNKPHQPSPETVTVMTKPELDEMNSHNEKGAAWCGWRP